jgi:hypothetical protein
LLGRISKIDLADELWPVLERKMRRAERRRTEAKIPIVRVLDRALDLAGQYPGHGFLIELEPKSPAAAR